VQEPSANQWAPTLDTHEPNPPLSLEEGIVQRPPLVTRITLRPALAVALLAFAPNTLLSTLAPVSVPFAQLDWPNPQLRQHAQDAQALGGVLVDLTPPPAAGDWPLPLRKPLDVSRLTWLQSPAVPPAVAAAPVPASDWPLPARKPLDVARLTWSDTTRLPAMYAVQPPAVADWPNPQFRRAGQDSATPPNLLASTLATQPAPFAQADWPLPGRKPLDVSRLSWSDTFRLPAIYAVQPPAALDWPLPVRKPLDVARLTWTDGATLPLQVAPGVPVAAFDWPLPVRKPLDVSRLSWSDTFRLPEIYAVQPPAALDWPLPGRKPLDVARLTWTKSLELAAQPAPTLPPAAGDWPNPLAPRRLPDYTLAVNLQQSTLAPPQAPPPCFSLPVPRGYAFPLANRGHIQVAAVWLIGQDTFFGPPGKAPAYDWPNPRIKGRAIGLRTLAFTLPPDTLASGIVTPIYGFARSRIGTASAIDSAASIGSTQANDAAGGIGSETANDPANGIGSEDA
jgi:hypothetical protein